MSVAAEWKSWPKVGEGKAANGKRYREVVIMGLNNSNDLQRCCMGGRRYRGLLRSVTSWDNAYPVRFGSMSELGKRPKPGDMGLAIVGERLGRDGLEREYQRYVMASIGPRFVGDRLTADDFRGAQ